MQGGGTGGAPQVVWGGGSEGRWVGNAGWGLWEAGRQGAWGEGPGSSSESSLCGVSQGTGTDQTGVPEMRMDS